MFSATLPRFVIGRPGYDNWLVDRAHHLGERGRVALIDATASNPVVHMTDEDGNQAFGGKLVSSKADRDFNRHAATAAAANASSSSAFATNWWDHGTAKNAGFESFEAEGGGVGVRRRGADRGVR